jgi:hypothetical protein
MVSFDFRIWTVEGDAVEAAKAAAVLELLHLQKKVYYWYSWNGLLGILLDYITGSLKIIYGISLIIYWIPGFPPEIRILGKVGISILYWIYWLHFRNGKKGKFLKGQ